MNDNQSLLLNLQTHLQQINTILRSSQLFDLTQEHYQTQSLILLQAQADKLQTQIAKLCDKLLPEVE